MEQARTGTWFGAVLFACLLLIGCGGKTGLGAPPANFAQGLHYGPIIGSLTPSQVTFRWALPVRSASSVELRELGSTGAWRRVDSGSTLVDHEVVVDGLQAETDYAYRLRIGDVIVPRSFTFRTPSEDPNVPIRIAVIGDMGCGCAVQLQLIDMIDRQDPDLVLLTGDLAYNGGSEGEVFHRFTIPFADLMSRVPLYATLGNHDVTSAGGRPLLSVLPLPRNDEDGTEQYYAFELGAARFVSINAEFGISTGDAPQLQWLDRTLAAPSPGWTFVFAHRPTYSVSRQGDHVYLRAHVVPLLDVHGVDFFLSGHDHNYQRTHPMRNHTAIPMPGDLILDAPGTAYLVSGGGGKSLYPINEGNPRTAAAEAVYHFTMLDVSPKEVRVRPIRLDGSLIEDVRYTRSP